MDMINQPVQSKEGHGIIIIIITDNLKQGKQNSTQAKHKGETEKTALASNTNNTLVWYAFYNIWAGNRPSPLTALEHIRGGVRRYFHIMYTNLPLDFACNGC